MASFKNAHTHSAMTLLRGYADDMPLQEWLTTRIWPTEACLTPEDIYWGTRLAAVEMIKSGTTFANDMYFQFPQVCKAFEDSGMRAAVGLALFDFNDSTRTKSIQKEAEHCIQEYMSQHNIKTARVFPTVAPHSIYTCSTELLQWAAAFAKETNIVYHIHMSETQKEVTDCLAAHGIRPFQLLDTTGVLQQCSSNIIAAHAIWVNNDEVDLLSTYDITVVHNPASNMKLASGAFPYQQYADAGISMMLASDGVASNNNLDIFDDMKLAALLQKHHFQDSTRLSATETFALATGKRSNLFSRFGISGMLTEQAPADIILLDTEQSYMTPNHNIKSNIVYAANSSIVSTVICDGNVLMDNGIIQDESIVYEKAARCAANLIQRAKNSGVSL